MIEVVVPGKGRVRFPDGMPEWQMREAIEKNFFGAPGIPKPIQVEPEDIASAKQAPQAPVSEWGMGPAKSTLGIDGPPVGEVTMGGGGPQLAAMGIRFVKGLTDVPFLGDIPVSYKGGKETTWKQTLDRLEKHYLDQMPERTTIPADVSGGAAELLGSFAPLSAATKIGYGIAKKIPMARRAFQRLAGGAISGALYEADDPEAALHTAALFSTLEGVGIGAKAIWEGLKPTWYRLTVKERGMVVQDIEETISRMKAEGKTEGQIIRELKRKGDLKPFEEALSKRVQMEPNHAPTGEPFAQPAPSIPPLENAPPVGRKPAPVRPSGPLDLGRGPGVIAPEPPISAAAPRGPQASGTVEAAPADPSPAPDTPRPTPGQATTETGGVPTIQDAPKPVADIAANPAVEVQQKPFAETKKQETERLDAENKAPVDTVLEYDPDNFRRGFVTPARSKKLMADFVKATPEFKLAPIFEVVDGEKFPNLIGGGKRLLFRDKYQFAFHPSAFGLDAEELAVGSRIRVDLDSWSGKKIHSFSNLSLLESFGGGLTHDTGTLWGGKSILLGGKGPGTIRDKVDVPSSAENFIRRKISDVTTEVSLPDRVYQIEKGLDVVRLGDQFFDVKPIKFLLSNASGPVTFKTAEGIAVAYHSGEPVALISATKQDNPAESRAVPFRVLKPKKRSPLQPFKFSAAEEPKGTADFRPGVERDISFDQFYQKERGGESTVDRGGDTETVRALDLPEIVELARELLGGKYPRIKAKLTGTSSYGYYRGPGKEIGINPDTAKTEDIAWVLAHEIGHLVDDLPEFALKQRGNVLGRIATLKNYMQSYLAGEPGGPGPLTDAEKAALKAQAEESLRIVTEEGIDEVIRRTLPIKPEDVLAIWNGVAPRDSELYKYIARIDAAMKKSIVVAAMKGQLPADIQRFAKVVEERTGRKTTTRTVQEPTDEQVRAKLRDLIEEEIKRRNLLARDVIMEELRTLTRDLKPMDEATLSRKMKRYRYSGKEMYANAISALINNPQYLKDTAPQFWRGFHAYMEAKPEVKRVYDDIQKRLTDPEAVGEARRARRHAGYEAGEAAYAERAKRDKPSLRTELVRQFIDMHAPVIRDVKAAKKAGKIVTPANNPVYALEEFVYRAAQVREYLTAMGGIDRARKAAGIAKADFSDLLFFRRVATERAQVANPWGYDQKTAQQELERLKQRLGVDTYAKAEALVNAFQEARKTRVVDFVEGARVWTPELVDFAQNNPNWARFDVVKYIEEKYGSLGQASAKVYRKVGTFADIADPFTASVLNDMAIIHATNAKIAAKSVVDFYLQHFPESVVEAKAFAKRPSGNDWELVEFPHDGKKVGYYLPRDVATSIFDDPYQAQVVGKVLLTPLFRELFVGLNPGFMAFNAIRDFQRTLINLPQGKIERWVPYSGIPRLAYWWVKSLPESVKDAYGIPSDIVEELYRTKKLISVSSSGYAAGGAEDEFERQMARFMLSGHLQNKGFWRSVASALHDLNSAIEKNTKVASYQYLKANQQRLGMADEEIGHAVRSQLGSPDFLRKGKAYHFYNTFYLFANAIKEGWRGDWDVAKSRPAEYAWKRIQYTILPKLLMVLGASGGLGAGVKAIYDKTSEYDKTNYFVIPLGMTPEGKAVILRIPQDETGRVLGGVVWKNYSKEGAQAAEDLLAFGSGQIPGVSPLPGILKDVADYASGRVPHDEFRNQPAISQDVYDAREASPEARLRSAKEFGKYLWNKSGGGLIHRFKSDRVEGIQGELEQLLGFPISSNILGRFVKVTDQGEREEYRDVARKVAAEEADKRIKKRAAIVDALNSTDAPDAIVLFAELAADNIIDIGPAGKDLRSKAAAFLREYRRFQAGAESAAVQAIANGASTAQKAAMLTKARAKMGNSEFNGLLLHLLGNQLISRDVVVLAAMAAAKGR